MNKPASELIALADRPAHVTDEISRIKRLFEPANGGDKEDLISYAVEVAALRLASSPSEAMRVALERMIYETTHLSAARDDGSHDCRISKAALTKAREALSVPLPPVKQDAALGAGDEEKELFAAVTKFDLAGAIKHLRNWAAYKADEHCQEYASLIEAQAKLIAWFVKEQTATSEPKSQEPDAVAYLPFDLPTWKQYEHRMKRLMSDVGMPNSTSLYQAMWQLIRDVEHIDKNTHPTTKPEASQEPEAVAVKPLEWYEEPLRNHENPAWNATTDFGSNYRVFKAWRGKEKKAGWIGNGEFHNTEAEAKAAAQADYEQRIKSALIPTTKPEAQAVSVDAIARELPRLLYGAADECEPDEWDKLTVSQKTPFMIAARTIAALFAGGR